MLKLENIKKTYDHNGNSVEVFDSLNLEISKGEFISVFGPNGCGKTTLLNLISGLDKNFSGKINLNSQTKISYIFQNYRDSIFPWLTIAENISYPLKLQGYTNEKQSEAVQKICSQFGIKFDLADYPYNLSGGQQQLVVILRGLITKPDILLFDEPLSSLDYQTTLFMLDKIQEIWLETKTMVIFVSHDIDEAITLSQKIILLGSKPTKIVKIFENNLKYPRKIDILGTSEFVSLKHNILNVFKEEIKI